MKHSDAVRGSADAVAEGIEAQKAAAASTAQLAEVVVQSSDAILTLDPSGTVISWNAGAERIYGYRADEMIGRNAASVLAPPGGEAERESLRDRLEHAGSRTREVELIRADGRTITVSVTSSPILDADGRLRAVSSISRDISDQKQTERALAASEERFRLTQLHSPIGLAIVGLDGRWLQVNPALCEILGRTEGELLELTSQEVTHPDDLDQTSGRLRQLLDGETGSFQMETRYVRGDGHVVWVLLSTAVVRDGDEPQHLIAQLLDIGARKRDEAERDRAATRLSAANVELVDAGRLKDYVLAVTNHELRTPLSSIVGFADLLTTDWHDLSEAERLDFVRRIRHGGQRMTKLVDDFLVAVTLASGTMDIAAIDAELGPVFDAARARAGALGAEIVVECPPGLRAVADPGRLAQILTIYLTNAAREGGGPIHIHAVEVDGSVEIRVHDQGPGVPPELVASLVDGFDEANRGAGSDTRSTGLGLSIARGLARAQGGEAWYEPTHPHGATFAVRIPASR